LQPFKERVLRRFARSGLINPDNVSQTLAGLGQSECPLKDRLLPRTNVG
jgi:hypothetical protein